MFRYDRLDELIKTTGKKKSFLSEKMGHAKRYLVDARKQNTNICDEDVRVLAAELSTSVRYLRGETEDPAPDGPAPAPAKKELPAETGEQFSPLDSRWFSLTEEEKLQAWEFIVQLRAKHRAEQEEDQ